MTLIIVRIEKEKKIQMRLSEEKRQQQLTRHQSTSMSASSSRRYESSSAVQQPYRDPAIMNLKYPNPTRHVETANAKVTRLKTA